MKTKIWLFTLIVFSSILAYGARKQDNEVLKVCYAANFVWIGMNLGGLLHEYAK